MPAGKAYDEAYFAHLYHDPETRVIEPATVARQVAVVVALAEHFLGRPVRRVLDVGCGEANWLAPLRRLRPRVDYLGLDPSPWVLARHGHRRNIRPLAFGQLAEQRFAAPFDIIIVANVLQYLAPAEIRRGLSGFPELLRGVAWLETYVRGDEVVGDLDGFRRRPGSWYRRAFTAAGLVQCGPHSWLSADLAPGLPALELPAPVPPR